VINAILYATSAQLDPILLEPRPKQSPARSGHGASGRGSRSEEAPDLVLSGRSSESVCYLPGRIDISKVRRWRDIERGPSGYKIMKRFMVRGHWRRANPDWQDQRLRWIEPYWKGPELARIIEHEYRLTP
jgi:hypothetical protein